jgi:primosomal protein N' (replication factor Y) (superfamily II helicase)
VGVTDGLFAPLPAAELPPLVAVALESGLDRTLTYSVPKSLVRLLSVGQRVKVPLGRGNRAAFGYAVAFPAPPPTDFDPGRIKSMLAIDDPRVLVTPALLELTRWISRYYFCPLGLTLDAIIPSAVKRRVGLTYLTLARPLLDADRLRAMVESTRQPKRRALYAQLLDVPSGGSIELSQLANAAGVTVATARKLAAAGVISMEDVPDHSAMSEPEAPPLTAASMTSPEVTPNPDQQSVLAALVPLLSTGFHTRLLMGVTGSGKTEVYLRLVAEVVASGRQAIVLVPEIALTPQTVERFSRRFQRVAYLHSGLSAGARHRQWHTILAGKADVIVGARSAVFAPLKRLGVIVVDEEHETSYKQDSAPRYHARDLAIKRAQIENCLCLLGSATPSLESYHRAQSNPEQLLTLPSRVRGLKMPQVELVDMKQEMQFRKHPHLISSRLEKLLRETVSAGQQAILLLNRRGYASFIYCNRCKEPVKCRYCDTTLTYHRNPADMGASTAAKSAAATGTLRCHYCLAVNPHPVVCTVCSSKLSLLGFGTQRIEEEMNSRLGGISYARADSDALRSADDYEQLLNRFGNGEISVLIGTQMIAKGLDYPNVTLVGVLSADTALSLPDFRAAERTFQLITQVSGRAGRGDVPGRVVVQSFQPDDPTIQAALRQQYREFAEDELVSRKELNRPPFSRMVRLIFRGQDEGKSLEFGQVVAEALERTRAELALPVEMDGPIPCPMRRVANYHRSEIQLRAERAVDLQKLLGAARHEELLSKADRVAVDVDPVNLL